MSDIKNRKLASSGLGYVGLLLAVEFAKQGFDILGFDIDTAKIENLNQGIDDTGEVAPEVLGAMKKMIWVLQIFILLLFLHRSTNLNNAT